jgi:hypothetical protein
VSIFGRSLGNDVVLEALAAMLLSERFRESLPIVVRWLDPRGLAEHAINQ